MTDERDTAPDSPISLKSPSGRFAITLHLGGDRSFERFHAEDGSWEMDAEWVRLALMSSGLLRKVYARLMSERVEAARLRCKQHPAGVGI